MKNDVFLKYLPYVGKLDTIQMVLITIGLIITVYVVCMFIEWLRTLLFKLIRIDKLSMKISQTLGNIYLKFENALI